MKEMKGQAANTKKQILRDHSLGVLPPVYASGTKRMATLQDTRLQAVQLPRKVLKAHGTLKHVLSLLILRVGIVGGEGEG